ncbi:MAG TPA: hypothetical protein VHB68_08260, partial [Steroidobacteraceae bacterium]|nr:hypothetical protein [Steroidobacteraceae bacterium]
LVRLPVLRELKCPTTPDLACKLTGSNLFLVESVSSDPKFTHPVQVPDGFPGYSMPVPHPVDGNLYVKLRDNPSVINLTVLGAQQLPASTDEAARAPERHAAHAEPEPAPAPVPDANKSTVLSSSAKENTTALPPPGVTAPTAAAKQQPASQPATVAQPPATAQTTPLGQTTPVVPSQAQPSASQASPAAANTQALPAAETQVPPASTTAPAATEAPVAHGATPTG